MGNKASCSIVGGSRRRGYRARFFVVPGSVHRYTVALALALALAACCTSFVSAQSGCDPIVLNIISVPDLHTGNYTLFGSGSSSLIWNGTSAVFECNASWTSTNPYVAGSGQCGVYSTPYISATFNTEKDYVLWFQVSGASVGQWMQETSQVAGMPDEILFANGTYTRTFHGYAPGNYDRIFLRADGGPPEGTAIWINGTWTITILEAGCELEPPEPPVEIDYCPDGIELVTDTIILPASSTWTGNTLTEWDKLYVRYAFTETNLVGSRLHRLYMQVNEETVIRQFYTHEVLEYDIVNNTYIDEAWWYSVPNIHFAGEPDYDPTAYAVGPSAYLTVTNGYNALGLVSACVIPWYGPSEQCPDGIEALQDGPILLPALNGAWETTVPITSTHIVVRYNVQSTLVESPGVEYDPLLGKFMPGIEWALYYVEALMEPSVEITFTLPFTGVTKIYDDDVFLEFYNKNWPVQLNSVCIIDATDYMEQLTDENCHLTNPDFVENVTVGWETDGMVTWTDLEENGAVILDTGQVAQTINTDVGRVWTLEVRAKDDGGDLTFGTPRTALVDRGMQTETVSLGEYYALYDNDIYVRPGDYIYVESGGAIVDSVCLVDTKGLFPEMDCDDFPEWNPAGSGDPLYIYLFKYIGDIIEWGVCEIVNALFVAANNTYRLIESILLRIPAFPDPGSGIISWLEWFSLLFTQLTDWVGINVPDIFGWFPRNGQAFSSWLESLVREFVFWLAEQLNLDPYEVWSTMSAILYEMKLFWQEIMLELEIEFDNALVLLENTANVFIVLADGVRSGVSGNRVEYIGKDFSGVGAYIWTGVDFINEMIDATPLSALNIIALGVLAFGLMVWTGKKFSHILEQVAG